MNKVLQTFQYGQHEVRLETGTVARQASGAVIASMGDTVIMVTVVGKKTQEHQSFFPLTVECEERSYAAGRIPGGFFKREGRPSENAILTCRLIDRSIRPLFPDRFLNEIQVIVTVMSIDPEVCPNIVALIGTSAAIEISGIPFNGPFGAAHVGFIRGEYILNPSAHSLKNESALDLIVAGTESSVLMVESESNVLSEETMLEALKFGHEQSKSVIQAVNKIGLTGGKKKWKWEPTIRDQFLSDKISAHVEEKIKKAYQLSQKNERKDALSLIEAEALTKFSQENSENDLSDQVIYEINLIEKRTVRGMILSQKKRIDGRDNRSVRPINIETSILPRTHGSAKFTRGETQAIVIATLGTEKDAQIIDSLGEEYRDSFMLHYNFLPYCVGETGRVSSPKRREIGHGHLAKRALKAVLPSQENFPYTIRVVSEITESNGSSSMASVCGTSLALMDAGVKIKDPVAGVAMGLVKEGDQFQVLTDILGDEDYLGDMDFKVAGTPNGITALQMDMKIHGITWTILKQALEQAKQGRLQILSEMEKSISEPRSEMSDYAPRMTSIKINPEKIREVIGKGGSTIRALSEETGVSIDIEDDGTVKIASTDNAASQEAIKRIKQITADIKVDTIYKGKVVRLMEFGAFVNILPGRDGLVHISQISHRRVNKVSDVLREGDIVTVKVLDVDKQGRVRLSMKAAESVEHKKRN